MPKIKLFVFDFDRTALGGTKPYAEFPKPFVRFLDGLSDAGTAWATNTGWPLEAQEHLLLRSGLRSNPVALIGGCGMWMGRLRSGHLVRDRRYQRRSEAIIKEFRKRVWPKVSKIFIKLLKENLVDDIGYGNSGSTGSTIFLRLRESCEERAWKHINLLLDSGDYYSMYPKARSVTLLASYLNKATALQKLQKRLRISPEETIAAGDGIIDLPMFDPAMARWMVCPSNAQPEVKAAVLRAGGIVSPWRYSKGVIDGTKRLLKRLGEQPNHEAEDNCNS